jgi:enamine deaminase RidA (YjgF/YER057c/UK114 family)
MSQIEVVHPAGWPPAKGYANGVVTSGRTLHIAGQIGWLPDGPGAGSFASDDFVQQLGQALDNVIAVVRAAGGVPEQLVRMTVYVTDVPAYRSRLREIGAVWRERLGKHFPAMALVGVTMLVHPQAQVEIEAVAALP